MIETNTQLRGAYKEIKDSTGWSDRKIGMESEVNYATVNRIGRGEIDFSHEATRRKLFNLQMRVRGMEE
jgi:hypothetical protein